MVLHWEEGVHEGRPRMGAASLSCSHWGLILIDITVRYWIPPDLLFPYRTAYPIA